MKGWLLNIVLLVAAAALGAYVYFKPDPKEENKHAIATITPLQVQKLTVEQGESKIELEKKDNLWFMRSPIVARADASQINRVLDILTVKSKEKLAPGDLSRFDLDKPSLKLHFGEHSIAFGTTNSLTQDQYVLSGNNVFLIPGFYGSQISAKADRLLTHSIFSESEKVIGFETSSIAAEQKDGKWNVIRRASKEGTLSQDDLNRWSDDWRYSSSLLTQPYDGAPGLDQIRVKLADGKAVVLEILQKEPDLVLGRTEEKLKFQYSAEAGKRMLEPKPEPLPDTAKSGVVPGPK